jgi:TIR domain
VTQPSQAVFISYASQDAEAVARICGALRAGGIEVWLDQSELRGGDAWDQSIRKQIKACALFVPIISKNTHERAEGYFRFEWKLAVDRSHLIMTNKAFLVPVVIDPVCSR